MLEAVPLPQSPKARSTPPAETDNGIDVYHADPEGKFLEMTQTVIAIELSSNPIR